MLDRPPSAEPGHNARLEGLLLRQEIEEFNGRYCSTLDESRLADWAELFTEDAFYVVISRENHDRKRPVGLIYCEGKGMLRDRAFAIEKTSMFAPRYLRHMITNLQVSGPELDGEVGARANYLVTQVLLDRPDATLHQVGAYEDVFRRVDGRLLLAQRRCIYDNLLVPNALCLPV